MPWRRGVYWRWGWIQNRGWRKRQLAGSIIQQNICPRQGERSSQPDARAGLLACVQARASLCLVGAAVGSFAEKEPSLSFYLGSYAEIGGPRLALGWADSPWKCLGMKRGRWVFLSSREGVFPGPQATWKVGCAALQPWGSHVFRHGHGRFATTGLLLPTLSVYPLTGLIFS